MSMKITAGLGSIDDYIAYVEAGADEVFIGYVPESWTTSYGIFSPLNRREVLYYNVQIGSRSELKILYQMYLDYQVPVEIALNALSYHPDQYEAVTDVIRDCVSIGFSSFIIGDMGLLLYLDQFHPDLKDQIRISVSGELSEMNSLLADRLAKLGADRIIFHRYMTFSQMKACTENISSEIFEYEAFTLNEKCRFHGAFCNSLHCDELCHMCRVPYQSQNSTPLEESPSPWELAESDDFYLPGESGCGLCALWNLEEAGVTHLKIVGRGNYSDDMIQDIRALKEALNLLKTSASKDEYIKKMKKSLFPYGCSGNCYY